MQIHKSTVRYMQMKKCQQNSLHIIKVMYNENSLAE